MKARITATPLALAAALLVMTVPAASAAEKGEWVVGLAPSYAFIVLGQDFEPKGGGSGLFIHHGLSESLALRFSGLWSGHDVEPEGEDEDEEGGLYQVVNLALGVAYTFDLLSVVPAIEVGGGLLYLRYQGSSAYNLGLQIGVSVDYWLLAWLSVGAAFHYHAFISNPADYPVYFDAGPRVAVRWR
jgi:hypothetical protein